MNPEPGGPIRTFLVSLLGVATLTVGFLLFRQRREGEHEVTKEVPAGESAARIVSLEKLRELGF